MCIKPLPSASWRTSQGTTATVANHETQMTYKAQGRMSSYASSTITSASYTYDATGQRTKSVVSPAGGTAITTTYAYDGLTLLYLSATPGQLLLEDRVSLRRGGRSLGRRLPLAVLLDQPHLLQHRQQRPRRRACALRRRRRSLRELPLRRLGFTALRKHAGHDADHLDPGRRDRRPPDPALRLLRFRR